jgi:hypothetical protein
LILAGIWTYKLFWETDRPLLEPHLTGSADISWNKLSNLNNGCEAVLDVTLENIGKRSVDVTQMTIQGWLVDPPGKVDEKPAFFPDEEIPKGYKFFDQVFTSGYLISHYPPGVKIEDSFTWHFLEQPAKSAFWRVTFETKDQIKYNAAASIGDFVCNYDSD